MPRNYNKNNDKNKRNQRNQGNQRNPVKMIKENKLEVVTAALLLSGKLRVNSIQLARSGTLSVNLFGEFMKDFSTLMENMDDKELNEIISIINQMEN